MRLKTHHIVEAVIVIMALIILLYWSVPKAIQSQHRAQITQLEQTMMGVKDYLAEYPFDKTILRNNHHEYGRRSAGPSYNQPEHELTHLYYAYDLVFLNIKNIEEYISPLKFPDWSLSHFELHGYAVYPKKSPKHTKAGGFSETPVYIAIIARVGNSREITFHKENCFVRLDDNGNWLCDYYTTPFHVSNGLSSNGEFLVDTSDIWPATKAVLLEETPKGFDPVKYFPNVKNIIKHEE